MDFIGPQSAQKVKNVNGIDMKLVSVETVTETSLFTMKCIQKGIFFSFLNPWQKFPRNRKYSVLYAVDFDQNGELFVYILYDPQLLIDELKRTTPLRDT